MAPCATARRHRNFARTPKKIRILSGSVLQEHCNLKRELSILNGGGRKSKTSAAGLLERIALNPNVALYVKNLAITSWRDYWENEEKGANALMAFDSEAGEDGRHYSHTPLRGKRYERFRASGEES